MKKTTLGLKFLLVLSLFTVLIFSCKKESNDTDTNTDSNTNNNNNNTPVSNTDTVAKKLTDINGNVYKIVKIGTQWWMTENLKVTKYRNGDAIPNVTDTSWASLTTGAFAYYYNNKNYAQTYGALYNWFAVVDKRGLAPTGWHVPTDAEYITLVKFLGDSAIAGAKAKETGLIHWQKPNEGATNESGFLGLPAGCKNNKDTSGI